MKWQKLSKTTSYGKTENVKNELLLLTKVISRQNVQSVNWFLYVKQKGQMEMS